MTIQPPDGNHKARRGNDFRSRDELFTPIYLKTRDNMSLPAGEAAYLLLSGNGLWVCRNHDFFVSSVRARTWPAELATHHESLVLRHPRIPRKLMERIVGFFDIVARHKGCEAGVLLAWHKIRRRIEVIVPEQSASVSVGWNGQRFPIDLHYEVPGDLGPDLIIVGDVHSHVYEAAYSSGQDKADEEYRAGLHVVVGRLDREPPDFHAEYVVDGARFKVDLEQVIKGYRRRRQRVSPAWLQRVTLKIHGSTQHNQAGYSGYHDSSFGDRYVSDATYGDYLKRQQNDRPFRDRE